MTRLRLRVAAAAVSFLLGVACSGDDPPDISLPDDTARADDARDPDDENADEGADPLLGETVYVAHAAEGTLVVRSSAQESADELVTLSAEDEVSGQVVCLVVEQVGSWVEVRLPSGPTERTGWVARDDVTLSRHRFRIEVSLSAHTLTLYTGEVVAITAPVALGPDAPPAGEQRFIKDLVQPPDPTGPYGTYAYGLSGSDNERDKFMAGSGVVALHGTGDPSTLGGDAPYGSIAVGSDVVGRLADTIGLPLGTPITVVE
jgi:lipoprotein-anchoring transpeptidase ErfK/SrfK